MENEHGPRVTGEPPTDPENARIDEASEESFPASDPPSWEPLHSGPPDGSRLDDNDEIAR